MAAQQAEKRSCLAELDTARLHVGGWGTRGLMVGVDTAPEERTIDHPLPRTTAGQGCDLIHIGRGSSMSDLI
jgi:hypothetical protein